MFGELTNSPTETLLENHVRNSESRNTHRRCRSIKGAGPNQGGALVNTLIHSHRLPRRLRLVHRGHQKDFRECEATHRIVRDGKHG
jgi:hypothetical protein